MDLTLFVTKMINTLIGIKKGMTAGVDLRGRRIGATVVEVGPNFVSQVKTTEGKDGYNAVQLAYGVRKTIKKPQLGHLKKAGIEQNVRFLREAKIKGQASTVEDLQPGQQIQVGQIFAKGDAVKVAGTTKGKGFQGGVKRYNFAGGPKTHGQSDRHRAPGSSGSGTTPGRVYKGHRAAGHMGVEQASYKGLEVLAVDGINNLLIIKGGVPGPVGGLVIVEKQGRIKGYTPPPEEKPEEPSDAPNSAEAAAKGEKAMEDKESDKPEGQKEEKAEENAVKEEQS